MVVVLLLACVVLLFFIVSGMFFGSLSRTAHTVPKIAWYTIAFLILMVVAVALTTPDSP
jgi:hypothetical protein